MQAPILYSFRRCPYAMRARLACKYSGLKIELREIVLRDKPAQMLAISPKGTVPVLELAGQVIDESWDIVKWAIQQQDPDGWWGSDSRMAAANELVAENDQCFKQHLDHYKYADRHPEYSPQHYREQGEVFLQQLERKLGQHRYLLDSTISLADIGILPFIRQFAHVDIGWFRQAPYPKLQAWMDHFLASARFHSIMLKRVPWQARDEPSYL